MILLDKTQLVKRRVVLLKNRMDIYRNKKHAKKVQEYYNYLLDKIVLDGIDIDEEDLKLTLNQLNSVPITEDFRQILYNNDLFYPDTSEIKEEKHKAIEDITDKQITVFFNNFAYVNNLLNTHEVDKKEYQKQVKESPDENRREILNSTIPGGIDSSILKEGIKLIGSVQSMTEDQYRGNQVKTDFESALRNPKVVSKIWVWSGLDNTRHENMEGSMEPLEEYFTVINEVTGETDAMLYPHDDDNGSPGNICNCQCDVIYSNEPV